MLDRTKFTRTTYVEGDKAARKLANQRLFKSQKSIGGDLYEIQRGYLALRIEMPMQVSKNNSCDVIGNAAQCSYVVTAVFHVFFV